MLTYVGVGDGMDMVREEFSSCEEGHWGKVHKRR